MNREIHRNQELVISRAACTTTVLSHHSDKYGPIEKILLMLGGTDSDFDLHYKVSTHLLLRYLKIFYLYIEFP